jgi:integrase
VDFDRSLADFFCRRFPFRIVHPDEMEAFFEALKKQDELIRDYVLLSLLKGARRSNVLSMRWDQIDLDLAVWRIPLTKNKESQFVPLTSAAVEKSPRPQICCFDSNLLAPDARSG